MEAEQHQQAGGRTADQISDEVVRRFATTPDARLRLLMEDLVARLHSFAIDNSLSTDEWRSGVEFLTAVGKLCSPERHEMILLSDTLGLSMVVDAVASASATRNATESTVLGPFYKEGSPEREMGASIAETTDVKEPTLVCGKVLDESGDPVGAATLDVWQNAPNGMYALQDPGQPAGNLRGVFRTGVDGRFSFWTVRPTDYQIPDDGPVGAMLAATGRHPWRPAHIHLKVSAPGMRTLTTHFFDGESRYLESDAVFGVKPSLVCSFVRHEPEEPGTPKGCDGWWYSLERDVVLARDSV